jgi:hypothetical protein
VNIATGAVNVIGESLSGLGGDWGRDGIILLGSSVAVAGGGAAIMRIMAGRPDVAVTKPDRTQGDYLHSWPSFLPDGKHFLFTITASRPVG